MPSFFMIGTPLCRDVVGPNFISMPNSLGLAIGPQLDSEHFSSDKGCLAAIAHGCLWHFSAVRRCPLYGRFRE
jgi:hypothetical protein